MSCIAVFTSCWFMYSMLLANRGLGLSVQARTAPDLEPTRVASTDQYSYSFSHYTSRFVCMQVLSKLRHIA